MVLLKERLNGWLPWIFGGGMAAGNALLSYRCTVPAIGRCAGCGSCLIPLASLAGWAFLKGKIPFIRSNNRGPRVDTEISDAS